MTVIRSLKFCVPRISNFRWRLHACVQLHPWEQTTPEHTLQDLEEICSDYLICTVVMFFSCNSTNPKFHPVSQAQNLRSVEDPLQILAPFQFFDLDPCKDVTMWSNVIHGICWFDPLTAADDWIHILEAVPVKYGVFFNRKKSQSASISIHQMDWFFQTCCLFGAIIRKWRTKNPKKRTRLPIVLELRKRVNHDTNDTEVNFHPIFRTCSTFCWAKKLPARSWQGTNSGNRLDSGMTRLVSPSLKLTWWPLKRVVSNRSLLFQGSPIFRD